MQRKCCVENCNSICSTTGFAVHLTKRHRISLSNVVKTSEGFKCPIAECLVEVQDKKLLRTHFFEKHTEILSSNTQPAQESSSKIDTRAKDLPSTATSHIPELFSLNEDLEKLDALFNIPD